MDWMLFWTALTAIAAVVTIVGTILGRLVRSDIKKIENRIDTQDSKITQLDDMLKSKVEKDEHNKDITLLRNDLKDYTNKLEAKLDKVLDYIMRKER